MKKDNIDFSSFKESLKDGFKNELEHFLKQFETKTIQILFIGNCFQGSFLHPMLEAIKEIDIKLEINSERKINIYTVKNKDSLELFERNTVEHVMLNKKGLEKELDIDGKYKIKIEGYDANGLKFHPVITSINDYKRIEIINLYADRETLSKSLQNLYGNVLPTFDIIFCCFELHFCLNWRYSLVNLLKHLSEGGIFIFSEISGNLSLMDGNFIPKVTDDIEAGKLNKNTHDLFKTFGKERTEYHYWKPEISFSNYVETQSFLSPFFQKSINAIGESKEKNPSVQFTFEKFKENIVNGNYSYLNIGLNEKSKNKLIKCLLPFNEWTDNLTYGIKLFVANGFNAEKYNRQNISWNYSTFSKNIQSINEFQKNKLIAKSLDIFASHDIIFPNHTIYSGIFSWQGNFSSTSGRCCIKIYLENQLLINLNLN